MIGKINSIETLGLVDGPGVRFVIFMQGCPLRCLYCHNPETWNMIDYKEEYTPKDLINKALNYKPYFKDNGGITFSGGEPLMQKEFLLECLKLCKENNIHTCIDTAGSITDCEEILKLTLNSLHFLCSETKSIYLIKSVFHKTLPFIKRFKTECVIFTFPSPLTNERNFQITKFLRTFG